MMLHCKNELTLIWLHMHEFQFLLRLYKSMLLSCLAITSSNLMLIYIVYKVHARMVQYNVRVNHNNYIHVLSNICGAHHVICYKFMYIN